MSRRQYDRSQTIIWWIAFDPAGVIQGIASVQQGHGAIEAFTDGDTGVARTLMTDPEEPAAVLQGHILGEHTLRLVTQD